MIFDKYFYSQNQDVFKNHFNEQWNLYLDGVGFKHKQSAILNMGSRYRPKMVFWGYSYCKYSISSIEFSNLINVCISIELLHKSTLLLDDLIDNDDLRYGKPAFHKEYNFSETIAYAFHLVGKAYELINNTLLNMDLDKDLYGQILMSYSSNIKNMTKGLLYELTDNYYNDVHKTLDIMRLETSEFVKNSLLIGYYLSGESNTKVLQLLSQLGISMGNLYQTLNDLEPFYNPDFILGNKGNVNMDVNKYKKNIFTAKLLENFRIDNFESLFINGESNIDNLLVLARQEDVYSFFKDDIQKQNNSIIDLIHHASQYSFNSEWQTYFEKFYSDLFNWAIHRVGFKY